MLTNEGESFFNYAMGELSYKLDLGKKLSIKPKVYYDHYDQEFLTSPFPPGFVVPVDVDGDGDIEEFPNGVINNGLSTNRRLGSDVQFDYNLFDGNTFTFGFNYEWEKQGNVESIRNFDPLTFASFGQMQKTSDKKWIEESVRQIWAIYIQDKWDITDNLGFTVGVRHDHYSDFEGTTNPRFGLVWTFLDDFTLKMLYGQAFRAPAFNELYVASNPAFVGNPDLLPEKIRTYEVGLGYQVLKNVNTNVNYFFNVIRDELRLKLTPEDQPNFWANSGGSNIQGVEFEIKGNLDNVLKGTYAFANYTYQDAESKGDPLPDVPKHKGNVGFNVGITKYLNANISSFISGPRVRREDEGREDSPGYAIVNLTLIAKKFFKDMKIKASLFNLLDKEYDDPVRNIPDDIPRPGRTFYIEFGYDF